MLKTMKPLFYNNSFKMDPLFSLLFPVHHDVKHDVGGVQCKSSMEITDRLPGEWHQYAIFSKYTWF